MPTSFFHPILLAAMCCGMFGACDSPMGAGVCAKLIGSPKEIAATPRAREDLELVALKLDTSRLTADQATYDRVVADVQAIAAVNPEVAASGTYFTPPGQFMNGKTLRLDVDSETSASITAGTYHAWDCLNNYYQLSDRFPPRMGSSFGYLDLKGNYNLGLLVGLYASLPGVTGAAVELAERGVGDGPSLCAGRNADLYQYAVMAANGDCQAGCIFHQLYCYESSSAGVVAVHADPAECQQWYTQFCAP